MKLVCDVKGFETRGILSVEVINPRCLDWLYNVGMQSSVVKKNFRRRNYR